MGNLGPKAEAMALFRYARILGNMCEHDEAEKAFIEANRLQVKRLPHEEQPYYCYDEEECQPRAMSSADYIVSEFVSMAAMARDICS